MNDIDTTNYQIVGVMGDTVIVRQPRLTMTKREALVHAAWLVALADDSNDFARVRDAVEAC